MQTAHTSTLSDCILTALMADIQFEEEQQFQRYGQAEQKPFMIRLVLSTGIVSTDKQAEYVLLGIAVVAIILAFVVPMLIRVGGDGNRIPPEKIQEIMNGTLQ